MAAFTNVATLSYNGNTVNSNVVTGELQEVLSAAKTAVSNEYVPGDAITYVVSIVNAGTLPFTGLTLTDNLGQYTFGDVTLYPLTYTAESVRYYVNGVLQAAPTVTAEEPLTVTGISVPAGGNAILLYEARTNQFAPLGLDASIVNEAVITGGGLTAPLTVTETVSARDEAVLTITKALSPAVITENGQLTYTFTIQNSGNTAAAATDNVTLTDVFDPVIDITSVTFEGSVWSEPVNYTYDDTTGVFATVPGQIVVPAATYTQSSSGNWIVNPGVSTLVVTGTV